MIGRRLGARSRWIRVCLLIPLAIVVSSGKGLAQNWNFDARTIGLGDVGGSGNLATKMIDEQRDYRSIVLPFGLIQTLQHKNVFDRGSSEFDPIRAIESGRSSCAAERATPSASGTPPRGSDAIRPRVCRWTSRRS